MRWRFGWAILIGALAAVAPMVSAHAQPEGPAPFHVAHLRGVVVDEKGKAVPGVDVTLVRNEKILYTTKTDKAGRFNFDHISGAYWLRMKPAGYSTVNREVIVGVEALMYLRKTAMYVILGPGACTDDCATVLTDRDKFEKAIRRNSAATH